MTRKTKLKIIIFILLAIVLIALGIILYPKKIGQSYVSFENKTFNVELAISDQERQQGLMYRETMDETAGMLFIFPTEGSHSFWMKNTLISLDMIRINEINGEYRVTDIKAAEPCITDECELYVPNGKSKYVLEINAGLAEKYNIKIGDLVYIEL